MSIFYPEGLRPSLPYIGKKTFHHVEIKVMLGDHISPQVLVKRPDYSELGGNVTNTEEDCVSLLVGFLSPNKVYDCYLKVRYKCFKERRSELNGVTKVKIETSEFGESIVDLLIDIREKIDMGLLTGRIGENYGDSEEGLLFSRKRYFNTTMFLSWAYHDYHFPIPDELQHCMYQEHPAKNDTKIINTPIRQEDDLISKYTEIAINFCKSKLDQGEQLASKEQVEKHLELLLKNFNEKLGVAPNSYLPDTALRDIWKSIPKEIRRPIGVTSKKPS